MKSTFANRGMGLETLIEYANQQYSKKGVALIQKVPTPWRVVRKGAQIVSAFPDKKSTVDFIGVYKGISIAFDAKSTQNKTRFPYSNIEDHQLDFMDKWQKNGGIAFFLIEFALHKKVFVVPAGYFIGMRGSAGSMPYESFLQNRNVNQVSQGDGIVLDYLKGVTIPGEEVAG